MTQFLLFLALAASQPSMGKAKETSFIIDTILSACTFQAGTKFKKKCQRLAADPKQIYKAVTALDLVKSACGLGKIANPKSKISISECERIQGLTFGNYPLNSPLYTDYTAEKINKKKTIYCQLMRYSSSSISEPYAKNKTTQLWQKGEHTSHAHLYKFKYTPKEITLL